MIDGGAPYISLAQAEFEELAIYYQKVAHDAAERAARYVALAQVMQEVYRATMLAQSDKVD